MITYAGGLYWRKSKWNGAKTVPAILSIEAGRLRLSSAKEVAFDVPCDEASAKFTRLGTMVLTVGGTNYDIVGIGAALSPKFAPEQLEELHLRRAAAADSAVSPAAAAIGAGTSAGPIGAAFEAAALAGAVVDLKRMHENIRPWRSVLPAAGVRVES